MINILSICTPTYNRGHTLGKVYDSLIHQTSKDYEWIIIDDGSDDNTREMVLKFIKEDKLDITYEFHENQGKHLSLNKAYRVAKYDYILCLDSDDWLKDNAVETINDDYENIIKYNQSLSGAVYLDAYENGDIIGTSLPDKKIVNWIDLKHKDQMQGDKCYVFKKDLLMKYEFVSFNNNRHMPPTYQFYLMSENHDIYSINKPLKIVEYLEDGISKTVKSKYFNAADNYAYYRKIINPLIPSLKDKVKNLILYNISYIYSSKNKRLKLDTKSEEKWSKALKPLSVLLLLYYKFIKRLV